MTKKLMFAGIVSFALVGCGGEAMDSLGTTEQASHSWGGYHWARTSNPFTVKLGNNLTSAWTSYLSTASSDWSKSTVLDTTIVTGAGINRCGMVSGRVEVCNDSYGYNGWLGLASINISGSHITQGSVKLNDSYYSSSTYNTPAWRLMVMCQEVGHTFGLDHQDEDNYNANLGTCMDYTNDPSTNQHPNTHDYDMLSSIYGHVDSSTTLSSFPAANAAAAEAIESWGTPIEFAPNGRAVTFERDLGNDNKIVTHVFWAL
jgi:hypothetical protein